MSQSMVESMRRKLTAKNITAMVLFGAIILVFVFFGFPSKNGAGVGNAAIVNHKLISLFDLNQETERISQYYSKLFGDSFNIGSQRQLLIRQALDNLIQNELMSQTAEKAGILATDTEVRDFIVNDIPVFKENGVFQRDRYSQYLQGTRLSAGEFEGKIKKDIQGLRARRLFELSMVPSIGELEQQNLLKSIQVNASYVKIDQSEIEKKLSKEKVSEAINNIEKALKENNEKGVDREISNLGLKWEQTGFTEIEAGQFSKVPSSSFFESVFDIEKVGNTLPRFVREGGIKYVVKLDNIKRESVKTTFDSKSIELTQRKRGTELYNSWIQHARSQAEIHTNDQLFRE